MLLECNRQVDLLQPVEVSRVHVRASSFSFVRVCVSPSRQCGLRTGWEAGKAVQREETLAGKVVEAEHVVVEHGEAQHGERVPALDCVRRADEKKGRAIKKVNESPVKGTNSQFETLVKDWVERVLLHVGGLLGAAEHPGGENVHHHERIAQT